MDEHLRPNPSLPDDDMHRRAAEARAESRAATERARGVSTEAEQIAGLTKSLLESARRLVDARPEYRPTLQSVLHREITRCAGALRSEGTAPERALVLIKSAVAPALQGHPDDLDVVMEEVVRWFVEGYFAA